MDVIGVIPARYSSTRFEGKVLADINGKPMLQHVWERARQALLLEMLWAQQATLMVTDTPTL